VLAAFVVVLYALALPYLGLMGLAFVGLFVRGEDRLTSRRPSVSVIVPAHDE